MLLDLITAVVLIFFLTRIVGALRYVARPPARRRWIAIVSGLRLRHFLPAPFVLAAVMTAATLLLAVPGLDFGWWTAIGGLGNPVTGSTDRTVGTVFEWLIPVVFLSLLLPVLPLFAEREERLFRERMEAESWTRRAWRCLQFGLVHALVGIPIGVALALSLGGAYFMAWYLRGYRIARSLVATSPSWAAPPLAVAVAAPAVDHTAREAAVLESTRAHLAYNATIVGLVLVAIAVWLAFG